MPLGGRQAAALSSRARLTAGAAGSCYKKSFPWQIKAFSPTKSAWEELDQKRTTHVQPRKCWRGGHAPWALPLAVWGCYTKVTFQQNLVPPPMRFGVYFSPPAFPGKREVPSPEFSLRKGIMCPVQWGLVKLLNSCLAGPGELLSLLNPYMSPGNGEVELGLP